MNLNRPRYTSRVISYIFQTNLNRYRSLKQSSNVSKFHNNHNRDIHDVHHHHVHVVTATGANCKKPTRVAPICYINKSTQCHFETNIPRNNYCSSFNDTLTLNDFIGKNPTPSLAQLDRKKTAIEDGLEDLHYLDEQGEMIDNHGRKVYIETYGCQMNVNDTEIALAILRSGGFIKTDEISQADVLLMMTCAIRESAEEKIRHRLRYFNSIKKKKRETQVKIGLLGCMAERLKGKLLEEEKMIDVICGPDAYRDLPRLLSVAQSGQHGVNVQLSLEETYADVVPVRLNQNSVTAYVSIMRGCDNMCSYCIVPFTRGRERSRPMTSIEDEVRQLSQQGIKEVTLLGQNVNSYRDLGTTPVTSSHLTPGFHTIYKTKQGGARFIDLLDRVSQIDSDMRIRFTSPHPKDFPVELLELIKSRPNICNQLHLPAQSGNDCVLESMRRGYTRRAYIDLVDRVKHIIPDIALSSDFIAGFCGETHEAHKDTVSLMELIKYNYAFCFPYSMRQKTHAHHRLTDDVPRQVKVERHTELTETFRRGAMEVNQAQVGQLQLVLIEGVSKRSESDLYGRNDYNTKVILPDIPLSSRHPTDDEITSTRMKPGDYVAVQITSGSSQTMKGTPLYISSIDDFNNRENKDKHLNYLSHIDHNRVIEI